MTNCYCGGNLHSLISRVTSCEECGRIYMHSQVDDKYYPAIPWKGFGSKKKIISRDITRKIQVSVKWVCPRCGFDSKFDSERFRVSCPNCEYSYYVEDEGTPPIMHKIQAERAKIIQRLSSSDDSDQQEKDLIRLRELKTQMDELPQEIL